MNNCVGKLTVPALTSPRHEAPANPAPAPPAECSAFNKLSDDLKRLIVGRGRLDLTSTKALRLTNHSFRQIGAERLAKLDIPPTELGTL